MVIEVVKIEVMEKMMGKVSIEFGSPKTLSQK